MPLGPPMRVYPDKLSPGDTYALTMARICTPRASSCQRVEEDAAREEETTIPTTLFLPR